MGLFGSLKPAVSAPISGRPYVPQPAPQGFFGRLRNMRPPEGVNPLMILGASLQEAGGQQGALQSVLESARALANDTAAQSWQREQQGRQRSEWAAGDTQTQALQQWVATLPPDQQAAARANPSGAISAFMTAQAQATAPITPFQRETLALTRRGQDVSAANAQRANSNAYRVLNAEDVRARGLPPGSYQVNDRTGQIVPIGRVRGQYTNDASLSAQFADRMHAANETLSRLEDSGVDPTAVYAFGGGDRNAQSYRQAQREFVNAILRRESGAAIGADEFDSARQQYFPVPNDPPEVREQKRAARQRAIQGLINASQGAYDEWYGAGSGAEAPSPPSSDAPAAAAPQRPAGVPANAVWNAQARQWRLP